MWASQHYPTPAQLRGTTHITDDHVAKYVRQKINAALTQTVVEGGTTVCVKFKDETRWNILGALVEEEMYLQELGYKVEHTLVYPERHMQICWTR